MNKHLKCFLKLLGLPLFFLGAIFIIFLVLLPGALLDFSGCFDMFESEIYIWFYNYPEWYRSL